LIEQIVAVGLVAIIVPPLMLLLSGLVRQAATSGAAVDMLTLARSQLESIKQQPYQNLPTSYAILSPIPSEYSIQTTAAAVKTYTYPPPKETVTLPDEVQLITVQVSCPECAPPLAPLTLQGYKVKR